MRKGKITIYSKGDLDGRLRVFDETGPVPDGWFYKGRYLKTDASAFRALLKDGLVWSVPAANGVWRYGGCLYASLSSLYDDNSEDFPLAFSTMRRIGNYRRYGIACDHGFNRIYGIAYGDHADGEAFLDEGECVLELANSADDPFLIASSDDLQRHYIERESDGDVHAYCGMTIKEKLAALGKWQAKGGKEIN